MSNPITRSLKTPAITFPAPCPSLTFEHSCPYKIASDATSQGDVIDNMMCLCARRVPLIPKEKRDLLHAWG
eukprot:9472719-Pyramimonas_sp.AAC.2